jgi:hypothetical protein
MAQPIPTQTPRPGPQVVRQQTLRGSDFWMDYAQLVVLFVVTTIGNVGIFGVNILAWTALPYWRARWPGLVVALLLVLIVALLTIAVWRRANQRWGVAVALGGTLAAFGFVLQLPWLTAAQQHLALALMAAVAMQTALQWRQWANAHDKRGWRYRLALIGSVVPSWWTYLPIVVPWVASNLPAWPWQLVYGLVGTGAAILLLAVDVWQEVIAVQMEEGH